jgi:penicillin-binding protein 1C
MRPPDPHVAATPASPRAVDVDRKRRRRRRSYNVPEGEGTRPRRWIVRGVAFVTIFTTLAWLAYLAAVAWWPYPQDLDHAPAPSSLILDRTGVPLAAFAASDGQWRFPLREDEINPHLLAAIVAVEDARFFDHAGVDWTAAGAAAWQNVSSMRVRRGASTITMQLHRLRDPRPRSLWAKLEQTVRARQIERILAKREILVEYLNRAPFGGNLVGAGAASWRYFGKPCTGLSLGESALLAGLPKNPNRYRPDRFPERATRRRDEVLARMLATGVITSAEYAHAAAEPVRAEWKPLPQMRGDDAPAADGALPTLLGMSPVGVVTTTFDAGVQRQTFHAARDHLNRLRPGGVTAAAVVVLDTQTAVCLAAVSLSGDAPKLDLTRRPRSTGSVLKPLIYAAAFEAGVCTPASTLDDSPAAWPGYVPEDFDRTFRGQMTAAEALSESRNIPAMLVLARTGVEHARGVMESAGLATLARSNRPLGLSLAVGGAEATPMEVAAAYAGLARGGISRSPSPQPCPPDTGEREQNRFLTERACWQVLHALSRPGSNIAWKTGTSSGHRDAWCAAATSRLTVVVWFGNADGDSSASLVGRDAAAPLALELIAALDPDPAPWPAESVADATLAAYRPARQRLTIISPAPAREIVLSDDIPPERQRVALQATGGGDVYWFVDGDHLGKIPEGSPLWWTPTPGRHEFRAVDAFGKSSVVSLTVRPD